jgi:hypothetical protein
LDAQPFFYGLEAAKYLGLEPLEPILALATLGRLAPLLRRRFSSDS